MRMAHPSVQDVADHRTSAGEWLTVVVGGVLGGFIAASIALSLAGLVFSGPLQSGLAVAISASLIGGGIIAIVAASRSSSPGMIAGVQDSTAAIIAAGTASLAATATPGTELATAFTAVGLTTAAVGIAFWAAGRWRLGRVLRFVPYPVMLGFVGATGVVIFLGAIDVLTPPQSSGGSTFAILIPGFVLGVTMFLIGRLTASRYGSPLAMVLLAAGIHAWAAAGPGRAAAVTNGWFLGPFEDTQAIDLLVMRSAVDADWWALAGQSGILLTTVGVAVVSFLLNAPAVAEVTGADIDVDIDLEPTGYANIAAGLIGSLPGFLLLSDSVAVAHVAGLKRATGVLTGVAGIAVAIAGTSLFSAIPTAVVGGVLVFIAANFAADALWDSRNVMGRGDVLLIVAMMLAVLVSSFGSAIVLGLVGALMLFVVRYAQIDVVRRDLDVADYPGLVDRSNADREALEALRGSGRVLELEGFVFFGTARQLADHITNLEASVRYLVIDLSRVNGIDSSASATIRRAVEQTDVDVILCGDSPQLAAALPEPLARFTTVASAVTWVENELLTTTHATVFPLAATLSEHGPQAAVHTLVSHFERSQLGAEHVLIRESEIGAGLFYIESGVFSVVVGPDQTRLREIHAGTIVGEISMYDRNPRATATVVSDGPAVVWHLSPDRLNQIERDAPASAMLLHHLIAATLAGRLRYTNSMLQTAWNRGAS